MQYLPNYHTSNASVKAPTSGPLVNDASLKQCSFYAYQLILCFSASWMLRFMLSSDRCVPFMLISSFYAYQHYICYDSCLSATAMLQLMLIRGCGKLKIKFTWNASFFRGGLSSWSFRSRQNSKCHGLVGAAGSG